ITDENPLHIDPERTAIGKKREADFLKGFTTRPKTDKERDIERKLSSPVSVDFKDTPLSQALNDLREWSSINIVPDTAALQDEGIALDRPVTLKLEAVSLKSALNLLLHQVRLTYVIADEALPVTTQKCASGKQERRTFHVE